MVRRRVVRAGGRRALKHARALALAASIVAASGCGAPSRTVAPPSPSPTPVAGSPVYVGNPAKGFALDVHPLGFDPDGNARVAVVARFLDATGETTRIMGNSDVDWRAPSGHVQWQTRMRYGQPSAILSSHDSGDLTMVAHVDRPELGTKSVVVNPSLWSGPRAVATAAGPHAVQIGWFPRERVRARIDRIDASGERETIATLSGASSSYRDTTVRPATIYRYVLTRPDAGTVALTPVTTPAEPPATSVASVRGTAMWLSFSTNPFDDNFYAKLDPAAIVARAVKARLHYVELRLAYGAYDENVAEAKVKVDAIVDGLRERGIGTIGWTVPREVTFEDVERAVALASYRTARGTPLAGIAIDLERGGDFMGASADVLAAYARSVREDVGPNYLIVATVEDPYVERLTEASYPYAEIAHESSVVQPMAYWRAMFGGHSTPARVDEVFRGSLNVLRGMGVAVPVSFGGDLSEPGRGSATPAEIEASLATARALGALGTCYFDWDAATSKQWDALARFSRR